MAGNKGKVLFFYPNAEGLGGVPNGIALLSACLKEAGFETRCFDTTFLNSPPKTYFQRATHGYFLDADHSKYWGGWTEELPAKIPGLFVEAVEEFKPDLIAVYLVDVIFTFMTPLLKTVKERFDIPIIAGGITATAAPELVIANDYIDALCVGEGEKPLVEMATAVVEKRDWSKIPNLWTKHGGAVIKNPIRPLIDMDILPFQDWSLFDERHYYKPYMGAFRRTAFIEMARGCPYSCTYCINSTLRTMYKGAGDFLRDRSIDKTFDEICYLHDLYDLEMLFFIDDNFLGMPRERFDYFCSEFKRRINLPFYIQTRSETVKDERIKMLKDINISTIAIGVEHGDEQYRKKYMKRTHSNANLQKAFDIVHKYDIRTTANIIIGMPDETEAMFGETVKLLQKLKPKSVSINYFTPYQGTPMRETAIQVGIIPADHVIKETNTCLNMPQFKQERIKHCYENLKKYVDGELELVTS